MMENQRELTPEEKKEFEIINENFKKAANEVNEALAEAMVISKKIIEEQEKLKNND